ncbi:hypothetical protein M408DRAFT_164033 [Serendipita vermifera MAFF 305830]|uniref:Uncharacterized protein n=1 Tax=Serendipita vermifera MAFF 305830 TaxID=933852 RepID=A0A0C3B8F6_SERVB|nr:hypothetical protein M408DRAFT_164033 [Serendipita vermifera MAFF 305830]
MACLCSPPPPSQDTQLSSRPVKTRLGEVIRQRTCPKRIRPPHNFNVPVPAIPFRFGTFGVALLHPAEILCASFRANTQDRVRKSPWRSRKPKTSWWLGTRKSAYGPHREPSWLIYWITFSRSCGFITISD